ncbi:MAG: hypothetical protein U0746_20485 [Gemmataceae bacterium]
MRALKYVLLAAGLAVTAATPSQADYGHRQYYSSWHYNTRSNYHYRTYYYRPTPTYHTYRHHYVVYNPAPAYKSHYYFYNPYKKQYWGRCPTTYSEPNFNVNQAYSLLKDGDRKETLAEIPDNKFPPLGAMPTIPEAEKGDTTKVELPPDDLPADVPSNATVPKAG